MYVEKEGRKEVAARKLKKISSTRVQQMNKKIRIKTALVYDAQSSRKLI